MQWRFFVANGMGAAVGSAKPWHQVDGQTITLMCNNCHVEQ
jgi:hypothetical protein